MDALHLARGAGVPRRLVHNLARINQEQWDLENMCREPDATADAIAKAKRRIDESNSRRHHTIDLIDECVNVVIANSDDARWYSETVGEICDRLIILDLKIQALAHLPTGPSRVGSTAEHLARVAAMLADDIRQGRAVLPPRTGVKVYKAATAGRKAARE
jgi:hypothetical protein